MHQLPEAGVSQVLQGLQSRQPNRLRGCARRAGPCFFGTTAERLPGLRWPKGGRSLRGGTSSRRTADSQRSIKYRLASSAGRSLGSSKELLHVKTAQRSMRHAKSASMLDHYAQTDRDELIAAQELMLDGLKNGSKPGLERWAKAPNRAGSCSLTQFFPILKT